ncbi:hypothetical protein WN50_00510 [Limnoraphis robusta CS-951]|uniref:Uncharacterized protein n=1 Tax=Limnoraphis robusta CS-951 TaxID=1637645 RepID=A0A0F5YP32_9CYAN|nr:hypothetical protein WN50_00510 [Limnoraphis robusta CS-951]
MTPQLTFTLIFKQVAVHSGKPALNYSSTELFLTGHQETLKNSPSDGLMISKKVVFKFPQ